MMIRQGDSTILEVRAKADPADDVLTGDFYTTLPQIRLSPNPTSRERLPATPTDVTLDETDVAKLAECAVRHPVPNMRLAVLAAIWNHPESFREIFRFGLEAPLAFPEIRKMVTEELDRHALAAKTAASGQPGAANTLLPRMPLPAHLRDNDRR